MAITTMNQQQLEVLNGLSGILSSNLDEDFLYKVLKTGVGLDINEANRLPNGVLKNYQGLSRVQQIIAANTLVIRVLEIPDSFIEKESADGQRHVRRSDNPYIGITDNGVSDFEKRGENGEYTDRGKEIQFFYVEVSSKIQSFIGDTVTRMTIFENFKIFDDIKDNIVNNITEFDIAGHFSTEKFALFIQNNGDNKGKPKMGRPVRFGHDELRDGDKIILPATGETHNDMINRVTERTNKQSAVTLSVGRQNRNEQQQEEFPEPPKTETKGRAQI